MTVSLARAAADLLLGVQCHGCGAAGVTLCPACRDVLAGPPHRVWRHRRGLPPCFAAVPYAGVGRGVVVGLKERGAWSLLDPLAGALAAACAAVVLEAEVPVVVLVPAPSSAASVRERGLDTTAELARRAASRLRACGIEARLHPCLRKRAGVADQAGLDSRARAANMHGHVTLRGTVPGEPVVLIDDVVTTGATLIECARVLRGRTLVAGAACVAARGWR